MVTNGITFEKKYVHGKPIAAFVCPGHPLLDATLRAILDHHQNLLRHGTVLLDENEQSSEVRVLFYLEHAIQDGRVESNGKQTIVSRQMQFVEINSDKAGQHAWVCAGTLTTVSMTEDERAQITYLLESPWLSEDLESEVEDYAIEHLVPTHLNEVKRPQRGFSSQNDERSRKEVKKRN